MAFSIRKRNVGLYEVDVLHMSGSGQEFGVVDCTLYFTDKHPSEGIMRYAASQDLELSSIGGNAEGDVLVTLLFPGYTLGSKEQMRAYFDRVYRDRLFSPKVNEDFTALDFGVRKTLDYTEVMEEYVPVLQFLERRAQML